MNKTFSIIFTTVSLFMVGCSTQPNIKTTADFSKDFKQCLKKTERIMKNAGSKIEEPTLSMIKNEWTSSCMIEDKGWSIEEIAKIH